ncbi:MAG: 4Fe-4S binding protein [Anaerolineae bacterium]
MADISVELAGLSLESPVIVSAGPLTRDVRSIRRLVEAGGLGAVVIKTIYAERAETPRPYMAKVGDNLLNFDWSASGIDEWTEAKFERLAALDLPIIASVGDKDDDVLADMACKMARLGATMIEVPSSGLKTSEQVRERVAALRSAVDVPISLKIGSNVTDLEGWVAAIEEGGADAITAINTIGPGIVLDTETGRPLIGNVRGRGYLSGPALLPLSLRTVADIVALTDLPVMGVGGVEDVTGALQMFMVGAQAVQMHTAGILKGFATFSSVATGLEKYLDDRGYESIIAIRGMSQQYLVSERMWDEFLPQLDPEICIHCRRCERVCVYEAIKMVERLPQFSAAHCHSCGLCISVCPTRAITYGERLL